MSKELTAIQKTLHSKASVNNAAFYQKAVPGQQKIYGVKTPELNAIVMQYKNGSFPLAAELWASGALEEKIIAIKIVEKKGRSDPAQLLSLLKQFAKEIDNWAVCDGLGMQFISGIRETHADEIFKLAERYNRSKDPWQRRLSLVMVEWYTRKGKFHPAIRRLVKNLENDEEYYVRKAITWINKNFKKGK